MSRTYDWLYQKSLVAAAEELANRTGPLSDIALENEILRKYGIVPSLMTSDEIYELNRLIISFKGG